MKIVLIKRNWLGGWVLSLYDLSAKVCVGNEYFILPGKDDVVAKQLAVFLGEFSKDILVVGIMENLQALCVKCGVTVDPRWRIYR